MELWFEFVTPYKWSFQSIVIRLFTWSKFSHVRVRLVNGINSTVFETNPPKARYMTHLEHASKHNAKICYTLKIKCDKPSELARSTQFINSNVGKSYDWSSVLKIGLIKLLPFTRKLVYDKSNNIQSFFCSELCLEYLEFVKQVELSTYEESVDPQKLYQILCKSGLVYESN